MTLTERLADYTLAFSKKALKPGVLELGKTFFIDCLGCIIAGGKEKPSKIAQDYYFAAIDGKSAATVIASGGVKIDAYHAAMINGISSHFHDYDDVLPTLNGHPSAVVLPAVVAVGEEIGASGEETLLAYILGVEVIDIFARGLNQADHKHYQRGWHTTSTLGIFGATAAAGKMLKLTREQLVNAFGIAASEASGIKGNFGTMTKSLHAGRAAAKGIFAAKMAQLGYGANARIMEIVGGFPDVTTGEMSAEAMIARMNDGDSVFLSPGLTMKPYPCCKCNQNAIDAIFNLMDKYKFTAEDVDKIVCGVQPFFIDVLKYPQATTPLEGKFSMSYNLAISILHGTRPAIKDYEGTKITDDKVLALMKRIEMVVDPSIANGAYANGTWDTIVKVTLKGGKVLEERVKHSRGESANPLTTDEVVEKLKDCMAVALDMAKSEPVIEKVKGLEKLAKISELTAAIENAASK